MQSLYIAAIIFFVIGLILLLWGLFSLFNRQDPRNPSKVPGLLIAVGSALLFIAFVLAILEFWASEEV